MYRYKPVLSRTELHAEEEKKHPLQPINATSVEKHQTAVANRDTSPIYMSLLVMLPMRISDETSWSEPENEASEEKLQRESR